MARLAARFQRRNNNGERASTTNAAGGSVCRATPDGSASDDFTSAAKTAGEIAIGLACPDRGGLPMAYRAAAAHRDSAADLRPPSGATSFPGPSLKYFRLIYDRVFCDAERVPILSEYLASILSKAPNLKLDMIGLSGFEELMERFPSQMKCHERFGRIPLDEIYERAQKPEE